MSGSRAPGAARIVLRPFVPATATPGEWRDYHAYVNLRMREDSPDMPQVSDVDFKTNMQRQGPLFDHEYVLALIDGQIVASSSMSRRRTGTPDYELHAPYTHVTGGVRRAARRQGVGMRLLGALADFMQRNGQVTASMMPTHFSDGWAFLTHIGAQEKLRMMENRLDMARVDWEQVARWEQALRTADLGLTWEVYPSRLPLARFDVLAPALSVMLNDQPLGTLDVAPMSFNRQQLEASYADMDERGGDHYLVLLHHGTELVAVCDANWNPRLPDRVSQYLTAVTPAWRGKGLAKAVKARMMRLIRENRPGVTLIVTTNAHINAPMLALNRRLGYVQAKDMRTYQICLGGILAALTTRVARSI
jgi:GNAT superfamily N-acetyltransferase